MRSGVVGVVLLLAVLSGCSTEDAKPAEVEPLASRTPSTSSGASTPVGATPSSASTSQGTSVPSAASEATPDGARAFAQHYFATVVNEAYSTGSTAQLAALSSTECRSCANIVADVRRLRDAGLRVDGHRFKVQFAEAAPPDSDGSVIVDFRFSSDPYIEKDGAGKVVRTEPPQVGQDAQVKLVRDGPAWTVVAIRTV